MRHQAGALEHPEVFVDAGQRDAKRARQLGDRRLAGRERRENGAACGIRERRKRDVEGGLLILNHVVKSRARAGRVSSARSVSVRAARASPWRSPFPSSCRSPYTPGVIYTIGHSTRELAEFLGLLRAHGISGVVDIRSYPASRRHPHFTRDALAATLAAAGIAYHHEAELGGRRTARRDSPNGAWRSAAFRGYADYMETAAFQDALARLVARARERPTAILCAEAVPWRCHRNLVADALVARGEPVAHILSEAVPTPHTLSAHARIMPGGLVRYPAAPPDQLTLT